MRVKSLEIYSYRGIKELKLDFDDREPTVLIGINGSGKTSVLRCLSALFRVFIELIHNIDHEIKVFDEQDIARSIDRDDRSELYSKMTFSYNDSFTTSY